MVSPPPRVLLGEDNQDDAELLREAFAEERAGAVLEVETDGLAISGMLADSERAASWALVILDLHLPKLSAVEILERIPPADRSRLARIVVLTGAATPAEQRAVEALGADVMLKPLDWFGFLELARRLKSLLPQG